MAERSIESLAAAIIGPYRQLGARRYGGEAVSQLDHAAQCAALAAGEGHAADVVCAAFLHDIGHLLTPENAQGAHERLGAAFLERHGCGSRLVSLVALHVDAKRYLTFRDRSYHDTLSAASQASLVAQGGPMSGPEAESFEHNPLFSLALELRTWDEAAKVRGRAVPAIADFERQIAEHLDWAEARRPSGDRE